LAGGAKPPRNTTKKSMQYSEFQSRIRTLLRRGTTLDTDIPVFIEKAIKKLEWECFEFQKTSSVLTTNQGQGYLDLPSDFIQEAYMPGKYYSGCLLTPDGNWLKKRHSGYIMEGQASSNVSDAIPEYYCIMGTKVYFLPIPDDVYNITLYYYRSLPALVSAADTNDWIDKAWPITFEATLMEAWDFLDNQTEYSKAEYRMRQAKAEFRSVEGRNVGMGRTAYHEF